MSANLKFISNTETIKKNQVLAEQVKKWVQAKSKEVQKN